MAVHGVKWGEILESCAVVICALYTFDFLVSISVGVIRCTCVKMAPDTRKLPDTITAALKTD